MQLTEVEKILIGGLQVFEVSKGTASIIFMMLKSEQQQWEMVNYMASHKNATEEELMELARKISGSL